MHTFLPTFAERTLNKIVNYVGSYYSPVYRKYILSMLHLFQTYAAYLLYVPVLIQLPAAQPKVGKFHFE